MDRDARPLGWSRSAWRFTAAWVALLGAIALLLPITLGTTEATLSLLARVAQRLAFAAFLLAFLASTLHQLAPSDPTRWIRRRRPQLGVAFVLAHWLFIASNIARVELFYAGQYLALRPTLTWVAGGLVQLLFAAMLITSFPAPRRAIGETAWRILHTTGVHLIATIFLLGYVPRALADPTYIPFAAAILGALTLRCIHTCPWPRRPLAINH